MNKRQKQVEKQLLDNEKAALKALEDNYTVALADVKARIKELMADELTQSKIYRLEYQRNLERQIKAILGVLESGNVGTVNEYLQRCYEDGFLGVLYDIAGNGAEIIMPINQDQVVASVTRPTEGVKLSKRLYRDVARLQKDVVAEISRGLSQNLSYRDIAINLANVTEASLKRAYRIARTEGHRVQNEAKLDSMYAAKDAGADIVKMWDATMDGKTRPDHVILDGQIRELDESFIVNGHEAMSPGHFGLASEDIHCRCVMLQQPRWLLEGERLKRDQDTREIVSTADESYKAWKSRYYEVIHTFNSPDFIQITNAEKFEGNLNQYIVSEWSKLPKNHRKVLRNCVKEIRIAEDGSRYHRDTGLLELKKDPIEGELIHEFGHAIETKLKIYHNTEFKSIRSSGLEAVGPFEILYDETSFERPIYLLNSECEKFISTYQRYLSEEDANRNGIINYDTLLFNSNCLTEYFSEGYREYFIDPKNLKEHDPELFMFISKIGE